MLIYVYNYKVCNLLIYKINIYHTKMIYNIHQSDYKKIKYSLYSQLSQEQRLCGWLFKRGYSKWSRYAWLESG